MGGVDLDSLNPEQFDAVMHRGSPLLLLAGAGSGKTRVVTMRIAQLVAEGVDPASILGVTFTNKAAEEMRGRIRSVLTHAPEAARQVTLCTFHSLGVRLLREEGHRVGVPRRFTILDAEDQRQVLREILEARKIDTDILVASVAANRISAAKTGGRSPEELRRNALSHADRLVAGLLEDYDRELRNLAALDFDDLLLLPVKLLKEHEAVRLGMQERYRHVLVDEYQDSNMVQLELIKLLAGSGENLVVVGDDDQSIYGWRGARLENILGFETHFPGAVACQMTRNYRSTAPILGLANEVIRHAGQRRPKELWTREEHGPVPSLVVCKSPQEEGDYIATRIQALRDEEDRRFEEVGVLFRTNGQARELEDALRMYRIPYRLIGGMSFYERREVKDALAYLRVLVNPRDEIALRRALANPSRGVGPASMSKLSGEARQRIEPLFDAFLRADRVPGVTPRIARQARSFAELIQTYAERASSGHGLAAVADSLFDESGLRAALRSGEGGRKASAASFYLENVASLLRGLEDYEAKASEPSLEDFLQRVTLDGDDRENEPKSGRVTLMTLHSAKGLEFPVVFLTGLEDGLLPHERSVAERGEDDTAYDEERRLLYVGITRAREQLTLLRCTRRRRFGKDIRCEPSRFLKGIPNALLEAKDRKEFGEVVEKARKTVGFAQMLAALDGD